MEVFSSKLSVRSGYCSGAELAKAMLTDDDLVGRVVIRPRGTDEAGILRERELYLISDAFLLMQISPERPFPCRGVYVGIFAAREQFFVTEYTIRSLGELVRFFITQFSGYC